MLLTDEVAELTEDVVITEIARRSTAFLNGEKWTDLIDDKGRPTTAFAEAVRGYYLRRRKHSTVEHRDAPALAVIAVRERIEQHPLYAHRIAERVETEVELAQALLAELWGQRR